LDVRINEVSVSITEGVVALLILGWVTQVIAGRARPPKMWPLLAIVGALLVSFSLTVLVATNLSMVAKELLKWIELAAVFLIGTSLIETPQHRRTLLLWLLGAGVSQAVVGLVQAVGRIGPGHFLIGEVLMRAYGTFEQPNPFGGYMGLSVPLATSLALFGLPPGRGRRLAQTAAILTGAALLITLSRGAWVAQSAALLLVFLVSSQQARRVIATATVAGVVTVAALWPVLPAEIRDRAASVVLSAVDIGAARQATVTPENWAVLERVSQWSAGLDMFLSNPVLGVGIGNYNAAYDDYRLEQWPVALGHAHNHYLTIAAEAGMLGLLTYLAFWFVAFRTGIRAYRVSPDAFSRALVVGILGALTAFATHNLFDVLFVHGMGVTIGLLLALLHGSLEDRRSDLTHQLRISAPLETQSNTYCSSVVT
ncbi:MAG TPA: O-antigen ligase family protein, partial [Chloroflexota bacterium]|nr:O-antigen ligase family protein [Chloroflexota bacterium]